jgi:hypothetical protein
MAKCPICYTDLNTGTPIEVTDAGNIGSWSDDPIKTPNHFDLTLRGTQIVRDIHIKELQDVINDYEDLYSITRTTWTPISALSYIPRPQYINELREAVEAILDSLDIDLEDWLSRDENEEPTLGITDWLDGHRLTKSIPVRGMHIEQLRKRIHAYWEDFERGGSASVSVSQPGSGGSAADNYAIQKRQLWGGTVTVGVEYYNHGLWWSTASAISSIGNSAYGYATACANAGNGTMGVASPYPAAASSSSGVGAAIPVIGWVTDFPCNKRVWNPITEVYDNYHLFVKANCSVSVAANSHVVQGQDGYINLTAQGIDPAVWDATPVIPNWMHTAAAECGLEINTIQGGGGGGYIIQWIHGVYSNGATPTGGIPYNLNNFDIDIAQTIIDTYHVDPTNQFVTGFNFGCNAGGTGNSYAVHNGKAVLFELPYPYISWWGGPYYNSGGKGTGTAAFSLDNIDFYYKLVP